MRYLLLASALLACGGHGAEGNPGRDSARSRSANASTVASSLPACGVDAATTITGEGIGALQIGRSVDEVKRDCHVLRDTTAYGQEALPERVLTVVTSRDTLEATIDSGHVWRIRVSRPAFRTVDSIRVGDPLSRLLREPHVTGAEGEGVLFLALPKHCGLSFGLSHEVADTEHQQDWSAEDLRTLPQNSKVTQILVSGCQK